MADGTKIEWSDATWNVVTGCSIESPGCTNCYAMRLAGTRLQHHPSRAGLTKPSKAGPVWTGETRFNEGWAEDPIRWKRPRNIFVAAHGDLFHPSVTDGQIMRVLDVMAQCQHHTFQVLTKRPARALDFLSKWANLAGESSEPKLARGPEATRRAHPSGRGLLFADMMDAMGMPPSGAAYPTFDWLHGMINWPSVFSNIWIGTSVERQQEADARRPAMAEIARLGWNTWVSYEPALGMVAWAGWEFIGWLVSGGESGPNARPSHPDWHRAARDFCAANGVPFLFKQWGNWAPAPWKLVREAGETNDAYMARSNAEAATHGLSVWGHLHAFDHRAWSVERADAAATGWSGMRAGNKHAAGRQLDGREWNGFPPAMARIHTLSATR